MKKLCRGKPTQGKEPGDHLQKIRQNDLRNIKFAI